MASPLTDLISHLEREARALLRSPQILSQSPSNINRYLEITTAETQNNGPKKRAQDVLREVKNHSTELFVLCALATNQKMLGTVKWTRDEILRLCAWWDNLDKPIDILQGFWHGATSLEEDKRRETPISGEWLSDAARDKGDATFTYSWGGKGRACIYLSREAEKEFTTKVVMRGIVRDSSTSGDG